MLLHLHVNPNADDDDDCHLKDEVLLDKMMISQG